jgi:acid phosphatase (class A)
MDINSERTPHLYKLMSRLRVDVRVSAYRAKTFYKRTRPYVHYGQSSCSPASEELVREDGSYPSARAAVGSAYALLLSELNGARREAIIRRGREFGESRVVCDAEWQSDVEAGETIGRATYARVRERKAFWADVKAAQSELAAARALKVNPPKNCGAAGHGSVSS